MLVLLTIILSVNIIFLVICVTIRQLSAHIKCSCTFLAHSAQTYSQLVRVYYKKPLHCYKWDIWGCPPRLQHLWKSHQLQNSQYHLSHSSVVSACLPHFLRAAIILLVPSGSQTLICYALHSFVLHLALAVSVLQLLKSGILFLRLFECVPAMIPFASNSRPTTSSCPSNPLSASSLAPQIRLWLTIGRVYKLYLLTYLLT